MAKHVCTAALLSSLFATAGVYADVNNPGFQVSGYLGGTTSSISPSLLTLVGEIDTLARNHSQDTDFTWGVGAAYRFLAPELPMKSDLIHDVTLGLDYFYFQSNQMGSVWQFQQPEYDNYAYTMPLTSSRLTANTEWTLKPIHAFLMPFVEGGIGFAYNTLSYSDTPLAPIVDGQQQIGKHGQYQFAYTLGAGVKAMIPKVKNTEISFRYLYANLGNAATSTHGAIPLSGPVTASLSTQAWVLGVTYLL